MVEHRGAALMDAEVAATAAVVTEVLAVDMAKREASVSRNTHHIPGNSRKCTSQPTALCSQHTNRGTEVEATEEACAVEEARVPAMTG